MNPAEATTNSANMAPIAAKLRQNAFRKICNFQFFHAEFCFSIFLRFFFVFFFGFSSFSADFGGARLFRASKSGSWRHFAADGRVLRLVRGLEAVARSSDGEEVANPATFVRLLKPTGKRP